MQGKKIKDIHSENKIINIEDTYANKKLDEYMDKIYPYKIKEKEENDNIKSGIDEYVINDFE